MYKSNTLRAAIAGVLAGLAVSAAAAPVSFIGYDSADQSANGVIPVSSAFSAQRTVFEGLLVNVARESFGSGASSPATSLATPGLGADASITQTALILPGGSDEGLRGSVKNDPRPGGVFPGRYNTSGHGAGNQSPAGAWFETDGGFSLNLGGPFQAFGFDATDFGDFEGTLTMQLFRSGAQLSLGNQVQSQLLTLTRPVGSATGNGSVLFFGFASEIEFDRIDFFVQQVQPTFLDTYDVIGFDQLTIGRLAGTTPPGQVPVPGTLALVAIAFLGLGAIRRRPAAA